MTIDNIRPTFWQWFDSRKAQALATDIGKHMTALGFDIAHTGGGCLAWSKPAARAKWSIWITDEDAGLGDDLPDWQTSATFGTSMMHDDSGDYQEGPNAVTLAECIAWKADSREPHATDSLQIVYTGDNEGPAVMTLGELIGNFDMSGGWYDRMSAEHMREELDSRGWVSGLHENGHYLVASLAKLNLAPAKPACEPVDDEADKPACRHRDDGRGRCIDCGAFL